jgi:hypothetical protein
MSARARGTCLERTSRHHRDTLQAINDAMSALEAKADMH